jgi:hypothetical protein
MVRQVEQKGPLVGVKERERTSDFQLTVVRVYGGGKH